MRKFTPEFSSRGLRTKKTRKRKNARRKRKRKDAKLRKRENFERYRLILQNSVPCGIFIRKQKVFVDYYY